MVDGVDNGVFRRLKPVENEFGHPAGAAPEVDNLALLAHFCQVEQSGVDPGVEREVGEAREGVFFARCYQIRASWLTAVAVLIQLRSNRTCYIGRL